MGNILKATAELPRRFAANPVEFTKITGMTALRGIQLRANQRAGGEIRPRCAIDSYSLIQDLCTAVDKDSLSQVGRGMAINVSRERQPSGPAHSTLTLTGWGLEKGEVTKLTISHIPGEGLAVGAEDDSVVTQTPYSELPIADQDRIATALDRTASLIFAYAGEHRTQN